MKTPMQRLLDVLEGGYIIGDVKPNVLVKFIKGELLEYEQEVIMDAFQEGKWDGWQNHKLKVNDKESQWTDPADYYNKTFNNK